MSHTKDLANSIWRWGREGSILDFCAGGAAVQSCRSITASSINGFLEMCQIPFQAFHMN